MLAIIVVDHKCSATKHCRRTWNIHDMFNDTSNEHRTQNEDWRHASSVPPHNPERESPLEMVNKYGWRWFRARFTACGWWLCTHGDGNIMYAERIEKLGMEKWKGWFDALRSVRTLKCVSEEYRMSAHAASWIQNTNRTKHRGKVIVQSIAWRPKRTKSSTDGVCGLRSMLFICDHQKSWNICRFYWLDDGRWQDINTNHSNRDQSTISCTNSIPWKNTFLGSHLIGINIKFN